jgi:hypothetical protein
MSSFLFLSWSPGFLMYPSLAALFHLGRNLFILEKARPNIYSLEKALKVLCREETIWH